jgi:hypothetical protein
MPDPERYELICRKVVLIIGGTSGIGRATAIALTEPPTMFSSRIRLISATVVGFDTKLWPARTIFSDSAPSKCELRYATIPSELSAPRLSRDFL